MKKLLSIFLVFLLSLPAVGVLAEGENVDAAIASPQADVGKELLLSLGIEGSYDDYSAEAPRGEVLSLIMQMMNTNSASVESSPFLDVSPAEPLASYTSAALAYGIISPSERFSPSKEILMSEAAKMSVVALGYANEAILMGGYPYGYLTCANKLGLFDFMANPSSETLSIGDMYVLLKNMSEVDIRIRSSFGDSEQYTVTEGVNLITYYHRLYEIEGIVEANEYTSLYDPDIKSGEGCITVDSAVYKYDGEVVLGANIRAYVRDNGTTDEIVYAYSYDTSVLTVLGKDVDYIDGNSVSYTTADGKEAKIKTVALPAVIYNGHSSANIASLTDEVVKGSEITFVSNNGDRVYDVVSIMQSSSFVVSGTNEKLSKIYDKNSVNTLTTDDNSKEYLIYVDGEKSDISAIKENTIADVYVSENQLLITVKICSDNVVGEITGYSDQEKAIYIDDVKYEYNSYFETYYKNNAVIGKEITAFLNSSGIITGAEMFASGSLKYGYFLQSRKDSGMDSKYYARIFTADGKYEVFPLADKVTVDSVSGITPDVVVSSYLTSEQLIRYGLDSAKRINKIDTEYSHEDRANANPTATCGFKQNGADDSDSLIRYSFPSEDTTTTVYFKYNAMHPHFSLSSTSVVFVVDKSLDMSDEKRCLVTNRSRYSNDQKIPSNSIRPYNVSTNGNAEVMVEYSAASVSLSGDGAKYGVVQSFNRAVTPDGDSAIKLVMYTSQNKIITAYIKDETLLDSLYQSDVSKANGDLPISAGDIIRCAVNTSDIVEAITIDYDYSTKTVINKFTGTNVLRSDYQGYMYAYNPEDQIIFLSTTSDYSKIEEADKLAVFTWGYACIFDSAKKMVYPAAMSDIITYEKDPSACDFVYLRVNWAQGNLAVVYR